MASPWLRQWRLGAGLVLLAFVSTHLLNHALGLVSLAAMEEGRLWFLRIWRHPVGTAALYGALATHGLLALWFLYERRSLRMPLWQALQVTLGLCLPPLLLGHVLGTRVAHAMFDTGDPYARILLIYGQLSPELGAKQALVLTVAWIHGCMGLHYWLRFRAWYPRAVTWLFGVALLVPVLALLGFAEATREVSRLAAAPAWAHATLRENRHPGPAERATLGTIQRRFLHGYAGALGVVLLARTLRALHARRRTIRIGYPDGRIVQVTRGFTVLEASRGAGVPHASVCGGRGRCSTCRVRIGRGLERLPPPSVAEARVLQRVNAPPNVRLACQLRPQTDVTVVPVLPALPPPRTVVAAEQRPGLEQEIAVLFAD
ncbi:MAG: 2Fe-2S iron-sulfur cluster-binding protein, partial [Candidatus Rokuibacteriota bacterium]